MGDPRDMLWREAGRTVLALAVPSPEVPVASLRCVPGVAEAARYHGLSTEAYAAAVEAGRKDLAVAFRPLVAPRQMVSMRMLSVTARLLSGLSGFGIPALVIKGVALAAQTRAIPLGRPSGDIDLLIDPADVLPAHQALLAMGATLGERFPVPDESRVFRYFVSLRHEATYMLDGVKIDLHWHLGSVRRLLPPAREVMSRAVVVEVKGVSIPTLSIQDALVHSTVHWRTFGFQKLKYVADLQSLAAQMSVADINAQAVFVRKVLAVSTAMRAATFDWQPTSPAPRWMWAQAVRALVPHDPQSPITLRRRARSLASQLNETPGTDRLLVPVRGAVGPLTRQYQRWR